jgi:hypothetical protein
MERSIVVVTAAMVHYFRRPPHSISPRKEAARGAAGAFATLAKAQFMTKSASGHAAAR